MATEWFCKIMGEEWGPMSAEELIAVARRGRLTRDDNVKRGNQGTWVRAEVVRGLFNSPPVAPTVRSDQLAEAVGRATPAKRSVVRSSAAPRYWIKIGPEGRPPAGPFSEGRIRQFAEQGVLKPFHLVSNDRRHWDCADRLRGLVFGGSRASAETVSERSAQGPIVTLAELVARAQSKTASIRLAVSIERPVISPNSITINATD